MIILILADSNFEIKPASGCRSTSLGDAWLTRIEISELEYP